MKISIPVLLLGFLGQTVALADAPPQRLLISCVENVGTHPGMHDETDLTVTQDTDGKYHYLLQSCTHFHAWCLPNSLETEGGEVTRDEVDGKPVFQFRNANVVIFPVSSWVFVNGTDNSVHYKFKQIDCSLTP